MNPVQCVACNHFSLKRAGKELARLGFGCCAFDPGWRSHSAEWWHTCGRHRGVDAAEVQKRREWIASQAVVVDND